MRNTIPILSQKKELNNIFYTDFYFTTGFKLKHFKNYRSYFHLQDLLCVCGDSQTPTYKDKGNTLVEVCISTYLHAI